MNLEFALLACVSITASWAMSVFCTPVFTRLLARMNLVDDAGDQSDRKLQSTPVPLGSGIIMSLTSLLIIDLIWLGAKYDVWGIREFAIADMEPFKLAWVSIGILILLIAGHLDDTGKTKSIHHMGLVALAILVITLLGDVEINAFSYPFDRIDLAIPLLPELLAAIWIGLCILCTKFLDGLDGFVATIGITALLTIASVAGFDIVNQPLILVFSLVWAAGIAGFLFTNFPDARGYLGEGPSLVIGCVIGVLSIISGAKIATTGSVIGLFIFDLLLVWGIRASQGRNPLTSADRNHWPQRLFDNGMTKLQVLSLTAGILIINAHLGLILDTRNKVYIIAVQLALLGAALAYTNFIASKQKTSQG